MSFVKDTFNALTGKSAEKAANQGAQTAAAGQTEALNYLKEQERLPSQFREGALTQLGGLYGLEGGDPNAAQNIQNNPIFQATQGMIPQQEEAILRNQSATGALRSGGTDMMLAENQRNNQLQAYQNTIGGLQGLSNLQSYAPQIAQGISGIGNTLAQGRIAGAQSRQDALGGLVQAGTQIGAAAMGMPSFSDIRLKDNVQHVGKRYGQDWFTWDWNTIAVKLGLSGSSEGVIADLVEQSRPELIGKRDGYKTVNYLELADG
jgi:hypothetical protein